MLLYGVVTVLTIVFFILTLKNQIKIKNMYHNGYANHRKAFILNTIFLIIITMSRFFLVVTNYSIVENFGYWQNLNFWFITIGLLVVAIIKFEWFRGSNFEFLGSFKIREYVFNLFKKKNAEDKTN